MGALVCSAVHSICDVCEMIVAIDLLPGAESIDKDRYTYPTLLNAKWDLYRTSSSHGHTLLEFQRSPQPLDDVTRQKDS